MVALGLFLMGVNASASLIDPTLTVSDPSNPGIDTFTLHDPTTHQDVTFNIAINKAFLLPPNLQPAGWPGYTAAKVAKIVAAATAAGIPALDIRVSGANITFIGYGKFKATMNDGEGNNNVSMSGPTGGSIDYELQAGYSAFAGVDGDGNPATYTAGLAFSNSTYGSVSLSSSLNFASLTVPTVDGLLTQQYNNLEGQLTAVAPALAGILTLDLANSSIDVAFPSTVINGSLTFGTTDIALASSAEITAVPEPSSLVWLCGAFGFGLAYFGVRKRKTAKAGTMDK
jgi:hypothetical protein